MGVNSILSISYNRIERTGDVRKIPGEITHKSQGLQRETPSVLLS
jgi:hypothetical protein